MGSRYTTNTSSGYNSSAPADDGSQSASNLVTWAGVKTKLADPVKNLADGIDTDLVTAFDYSVRQISGSDSVAASDHMKTVEIAPTVSSSVSVTLPDAATMTSNFIVRIRNSSTIAQSITRSTSGDTIDGVAGVVTIPSKASVTFSTNAAANGYLTVADSAGGISGYNQTAGHLWTTDGSNAGWSAPKIVQNNQTAGYTCVLADAGKTIYMVTAGAFTIPANSSVAYAIGTAITFVNLTTSCTIPITSDTMYMAGTGSTGTRTLAQYGIATALKVTSTTWIINGTGLS